ncbi:hypothetical protein BDR06DRAFT_1025763, partial [Suillus hirtellus]
MCPTLCPVAQCVIYCSLSASARSQNLRVISTLGKKPHVAIFVRSFYIAIDSPATVFLASLLRLSENPVCGRLCPLPRVAPRYGRIVGNRASPLDDPQDVPRAVELMQAIIALSKFNINRITGDVCKCADMASIKFLGTILESLLPFMDIT